MQGLLNDAAPSAPVHQAPASINPEPQYFIPYGHQSSVEAPTESQIPSPAAAPSGDALGDNLKQREYVLILDALKNEKNKKRAAQKLGISPRTLRYKMARMRDQGIDISDAGFLPVGS